MVLADQGIRRHDRVAIMLDNSSESVISVFGILKAGAVFIIVNPTMKAKKLNYILRDSTSRVLITHVSKSQIISEALKEVPHLESVLWVGLPDQTLGRLAPSVHSLSWDEVMLSTPGLQPIVKQHSTIDVDLASIIYTSGSTGEPKGVMCAHYNMVSSAQSITEYLGNLESDIILDALPLSFDYGLYQVLMAFLFGGTVVLEKSFLYPYKILEKVAGESVTGFPVVPTMVALILQMADLSKFDFGSLRYITNTAAPLPVAHIRKLQALLLHVKIFSMYGLTECKRVSYLPPDQLGKRPESVGIPMPNAEVSIVDESGNFVPVGEVGELVVRGSNVMQGYWNAPEETTKRFRPGRYRGETLLYTGDLFRRDEEGFLYFVARTDDMIKTRGERVSPKEIENALCEMAGVAEAAVIGVPDEISGQAIKAFIVAKKDAVITDTDIMVYCTKNLESFMIPKYVQFKDALPKTPSGKVDKKLLQ